MFRVLPGDLTAARGSGNIGPLNPRPLCNITSLSMQLCHNLAGTETGQAKPLLSKKGLFIFKLECQLFNQEPVTLFAAWYGSGNRCLSLGAGTMHGNDVCGALTHRGAHGRGWRAQQEGADWYTMKRQKLVGEQKRQRAAEGKAEAA